MAHLGADLSGVSVLVAGAGLAGLCAARDLTAWGATVRVIDARDRVGGRVETARAGFSESQHAEAGGDMIDESHHELRQLAAELKLTLVPILRRGFAYARPASNGHVRIVTPSARNGWARLAAALHSRAHEYRLAERRWDTPIATALGRESVAQWLERVGADDDLRHVTTGLRGFFLADPEELALLALVDQFAADDSPATDAHYRVKGGNDQLATTMAAQLGERVHLGTELVAVSHRGPGVRASVKHQRQTAHIQADYLVLTMPATLLRRIPITPALPAQQHAAIARVPYGRATKSLLQFPRRFWKAAGRPLAFGSPLPLGAVWDGNEEQRGRPGILSLMAGGSASDATAEIVTREGVAGLVHGLEWLGSRGHDAIACRQFRWEHDPWSRGGYAFFDTAFDPALRDWLARPFGRLFFAGEHTSFTWQGYMNGAVESGRRAAAEIAATHRLSRL